MQSAWYWVSWRKLTQHLFRSDVHNLIWAIFPDGGNLSKISAKYHTQQIVSDMLMARLISRYGGSGDCLEVRNAEEVIGNTGFGINRQVVHKLEAKH